MNLIWLSQLFGQISQEKGKKKKKGRIFISLLGLVLGFHFMDHNRSPNTLLTEGSFNYYWAQYEPKILHIIVSAIGKKGKNWSNNNNLHISPPVY